MSTQKPKNEGGFAHHVVILAVIVALVVVVSGVLVYRASHKSSGDTKVPQEISGKSDLEQARKSLDGLAKEDADTTADLNKLNQQAE